MFDQALLPLTWRVIRRRLFASPLAPAAALAFPAFVVWTGIADSYGTAARFFFFLLPHVFLIAAQDAVCTDRDSGVLENVLFIRGRNRQDRPMPRIIRVPQRSVMLLESLTKENEGLRTEIRTAQQERDGVESPGLRAY